MADPLPREFVLGIDLGTNSLGWALIALVDGEPHHLIRTGVRIFPAGMEGDISSGREESRNLKRRQMRLQRRQTWRRARRAKKIFNLLQRFGLLPPAPVSSPQERQDFLNRLDREILASPWFAAKAKSLGCPEPAQVLPYVLRAAALDEKLPSHFLGRALYHLSQRRGFLSNRKQTPKKTDDEGAVKKGISDLRRAMQEKSARTLGEYFSGISPSEERIRTRWTARDMFEQEFDAIWSAQAAHDGTFLSEDKRKQLRTAIFFQRPLWFDPRTIGRCELEPNHHRAPAYLLESQRFRLLQTVNNLVLLPPGEPEIPLTTADRQKLIDALESKGDLKYDAVRKLLGLTKDYQFNLERGGEKTIKGNRTNADFLAAFGAPWSAMSAADRGRAVEYVHSFQNAAKLQKAAALRFGLDADSAAKLAEVSLEPDYLSLSRGAIEKILPFLERGLTYGEARKLAYPESLRAAQPQAVLPPVDRALAEIRNPAVMRSLTELRKVVNAIVRLYGKPVQIRIELARELKKSKKQRAAISENNRRIEKTRAGAAREIIQSQVGIREPRPDDIRKWLLAEECRWQCPYSGKSITPAALFGPEPQFDIEHIIPFSRSMDNSFQNLTLCDAYENRTAKGNKTPFQAYSGGADRYEAILARVKTFIGDRAMAAAKLKRFLMNDEELETFLADFRNRQLNDTAYATSLAARYLGNLYGGVVDAEGKKRIQATSGQATSYFRNLWKLNAVLNDGPTANGGYKPKSREDHRHHAVDALVIGLTDDGMVKRLADAAQRAPLEHHRRFASLQAPWPDFVDSVRAEVDKIVVSHRVSRKVSGALHEETIYSAPSEDGLVSVRKPLSSLTKKEVEDIADPGVKILVMAKLDGKDPKTAFADLANLPAFQASDGRRVPIKRVRIRKTVPTFSLGEGRSARHMASESNHHVEIYAEVDESGKEGDWDGEVVSMFEASQRLKSRKPVIQTDHGRCARHKFSLIAGDTIECEIHGVRKLFVLRKMSHLSSGSITLGFAPILDARQAREMQTSRAWLWSSPGKLRERKGRKVAIGPLGDVSEAHD